MVERESDKGKRSRSFLRIERMMPVLDERLASLEDARRVIEVLVSEAEKGRYHPDLWQRLHDAALRDDMLVELSHAYEQLLQGKRLVALAPAALGAVLMCAAIFFHDVLGDTEKGIELFWRVLAATPEQPEAFTRLERYYQAARNHLKIAELYATVAAGRRDRQGQLLARRAVEMLDHVPIEPERAAKLCQGMLACDPGHRPLWRKVEQTCRKAGKLRDAADFLEREIAEQPPSDAAELLGLRLRVIALYMGELRDPEGAIVHVEEILKNDPSNEEARKAVEKLLGSPRVAGRAAAILNERRRRLAGRG